MANFPGSSPLNGVTYNSTTGALEVAGTIITGTTSYTLAQFLLLDPANYIGYTINISDIPTAHSSSNGVYVRANDAGTGWIFLQIPSFTTANLPTIAQASGWGRIFHSQLGVNGGYIYSNGTRFRLDSTVVFENITSDIALSPGNPTVYTVAKQTTLPLLNGKNIWGNGDVLEVFANVKKTPSGVGVDVMSQAIHIGTTPLAVNAAESNTLVFPYVAAATGVVVPTHRRILRKSEILLSPMSSLTEAAAGGATGSGGVPVDIPVTSLDSATSYVSLSLKLGAAPVDSALTVTALTVRLIPASAT